MGLIKFEMKFEDKILRWNFNDASVMRGLEFKAAKLQIPTRIKFKILKEAVYVV
ncbi:hypothetical protein [uncultured Campylobacter sp.]|uniref:hypothetical protein n=1 Tax=uncultured Campylobacter sp. TaxID=218934 RepID=UPI002615D76F|nr:hypothetical protein [uncultured Campylobacter sp.]